jgi:membrane associated rhomboid family serine protease
MHFRCQLDRSLALLSSRGVSRRHAAPLLFRLLWRLGLRIRPPHFLGFTGVAVLYGTWFTSAWGVFMWMLVWSELGKSIVDVALRAAAAGACFGLMIAWLYARERREFAVPDWDALGGEWPADVAR